MYSAKIVSSSREFSKREIVALKQSADFVPMNSKVEKDGPFTFNVVDFAVIEIHNDKAENPDYTSYVFMADDGTRYCTSSSSFFDNFFDIWSDMTDEEGKSVDGEPITIKVFGKPSKKFTGKNFLTCALV